MPSSPSMNPDPVPPVRPLLTHVIPGELVRREAGIKHSHLGHVTEAQSRGWVRWKLQCQCWCVAREGVEGGGQ